MARQQDTRIRALAGLEAGGGRSVGLGVYASPTATPGKAQMSPEVEGMLRGLNMLSSAVTQNANEKERQAAETARADRAGGRDFAKSGGKREEAEAKGKSFLEGYLEGSGEAAAISDAEELAARYQSDVDKRDPDIAKFIGEFYQGKMKGSTDPVFQRGYDRVFGAEALKLRSKHGEGLALQVIDKKRTEAQQRINYIARMFVSEGRPLGTEFLSAANVIARDSALSNIEKDEAILLTLESYGSKGVPSVFEVTRAPRVDDKTGQILPSMHDNPRWRERIERGEREAARIQLKQDEADLKAAKEDRNRRQQEVIGEIVQRGLAGDREGARELASKALQNRNLFTRGDEVTAALKMVTDADDDIEKMTTAGEGEVENEILMGIYTGKVTEATDISNRTDLGVASKRRLATSLFTWQSQQRQADAQIKAAQAAGRASEAQARAADRAVFTDPEFKASSDWLKDQLRPSKSIFMGMDSDADRAEVAALASAERELINWRAANRDADAVASQAKAQEIVKRHREMSGNPNDMDFQRHRAARMGIPYETVRELLAAHAAGKVDPLTFQMFLPVLKDLEKGKK
jgi:hypothetical protein